MKSRNTLLRVSFYVIGLLLFSLGITLTIYADIGVSSWDAVSIGLYDRFGFSIGTWMTMISISQIILGSLLNKERIHLESFLISIAMGTMVDGFTYGLSYISALFTGHSAIVYACGVAVIAIGCGTYLTANYLPAAIDYFMLSIKRRYSFSISVSMLLCEGIGLIFAFLFKGPVGYGTVIATLLYGPLIDLAHVSTTKLYKRLSN